MNPFEQYTLIIGLLAVALEGFSRLREAVQRWMHTRLHKNQRNNAGHSN